ncbi:hypothetical protein [Aquimarina hainanensis]
MPSCDINKSIDNQVDGEKLYALIGQLKMKNVFLKKELQYNRPVMKRR